MIIIDIAKCTGCFQCVDDCIVKVLRRGEKHPVIPRENEKFCIHCQHCLAVCPEGAISVDGVTPEMISPAGQGATPEAMLSTLRNRRSIRQFKAQEVDDATLEKLTDALRYSPTGCNDHRLKFAVVKSRAEMDAFRAINRKQLNFLIKSGLLKIFYPRISRYLDDLDHDLVFRGAPHMIVALTPKNAPCAAVDPVIALEEFELYAQTFGIGCCWCGFAVYAINCSRAMKKLLAIPRGYRVGYALLFGYPAVTYHRSTLPEKAEIL